MSFEFFLVYSVLFGTVIPILWIFIANLVWLIRTRRVKTICRHYTKSTHNCSSHRADLFCADKVIFRLWSVF